MYKIVAMDADGTLLNNKSLISPENKRAINEAQARGVHVALCSGRSMYSLKFFAKELELVPELSHVISFNGAAVFDGWGALLKERRLNKDAALNILDKTARFDLVTIVYAETDVLLCNKRGEEIERYTSGSWVPPTFVEDFQTAITKDVYKAILFGENADLRAIEAYMKANEDDGRYNMIFSSKRLLEFSNALATKGSGLAYVCKTLGLDIARDAIAIGDNYNDLSMIEAAALGVCVSNGEEGVKALADYVTENSNDRGGVAEVIGKFILN